MLKAEEIFTAWIRAIRPSDKHTKLAKDRYVICESCPSRTEIIKNQSWSLVCGECGCPLSKKVYSPVPNACPKKLWANVDKKHGLNLEEKKKESLF